MFNKNEHDKILNEHVRLVGLRDRLREFGLQVDVEHGKDTADAVARVSRASGAARTCAVVIKRSVPAGHGRSVHKFVVQGTEVDVLPCGGIEQEDRTIRN